MPSWSIPKLHEGQPFSKLIHQPTNNMKIKHVTITPMPRPMPEGMFDPMPEVIATFEDGSTKTLFAFYPDEISFKESDFTGLTEEEAHTLYQKKDTSYLRS
jgi:hypothetical protein